MLLWLLQFAYMGAYIGNAFPKALTTQEEEKYLQEMAEGSKSAKDKLIEHNLRLVAHIVKKYSLTEESEELISIGTIGLIKAVSTYKPKKGYKLGTYAARCIENEILMYLRKLKKHKNNISLQDCTATDKDGNKVSLEEKIPDTAMSTEDLVAYRSDLKEVMQKMRSNLSERERNIIKLRYGIGCSPKTQQEIANMYGISRSYVSRIEKAALGKLK